MMQKTWTKATIFLYLALFLGAAGTLAAQETFGTEKKYDVGRTDAISLANDESGNIWGCYRRFLDGNDEVRCVRYDGALGQWTNGEMSVPGTDFVSPLPPWTTNLPMAEFDPITGKLYVVWGPESRPVENGLFLQAYDPATDKWLGVRQIHSNQSERNAMVILPDGSLHVIGAEIEPFGIVDYSYTAADLEQLYKGGGGGVSAKRRVLDSPVSSFPAAIADSKGNIHLTTRWRASYYFRFDAATKKWALEKKFKDFGDRKKTGESCGAQHDGDPGMLLDPRNDNFFIFNIPWDLWQPSCKANSDGPQNLYIWDHDADKFEKLSDYPSYFIADYAPKSAIDASGNIVVIWPENYGYMYQILLASTGKWLAEPRQLPTAARFTNTDPFKAFAAGDIIAIGNTFHYLIRGHEGKLFANSMVVAVAPLQAPSFLRVRSSAAGLKIEWDRNYVGEATFAHFRIERSVDDGSGNYAFETIAVLADPALLSHIDPGASIDATYVWRLTVVDTLGQTSDTIQSESLTVKRVPLLDILGIFLLLLLLGYFLQISQLQQRKGSAR